MSISSGIVGLTPPPVSRRRLFLYTRTNNLHELRRIQRGPPDQPAINIRAREQLARVRGLDRAPINHPGPLSNRIAELVRKHAANPDMGVLCILSGGTSAGPDRPYRLIRDYHLPHRLTRNFPKPEPQLPLIDRVRLPGFTLIERLTNAQDYLEPRFQSPKHLAVDQIIRLADDMASFGMSDKYRLSTTFDEHLGRDFAGKCARRPVPDILSTKTNTGLALTQDCLDTQQIRKWRVHRDFRCMPIGQLPRKPAGEFARRLEGRVHFPVAADKILSLHQIATLGNLCVICNPTADCRISGGPGVFRTFRPAIAHKPLSSGGYFWYGLDRLGGFVRREETKEHFLLVRGRVIMESRKFRAVAVAPLFCVLFAGANAEEPFTEEAAARGINYTVEMNFGQLGAGIAFVDFDGDLDADLIVTGSASGTIAIYENDGTGNFIDRTATSGIPASAGISSVSAGDYDGDGDEDLHITRTAGMTDLLYRNDGGFTFTDVSAAAGIDSDGAGLGSCWGDYNGDGHLDIYVCYRTGQDGNWEENRLFRNNGDGTFTDVAAAVGAQSTGNPTLLASFFDYDNDGDADLYLGTDKGSGPAFTNYLLRNDGGIFTDVTAFSGTEANVDCMGIAYGDIDHNGYSDIYVTNIQFGHVLLMANGDGTFTDQSAAAGVEIFQIGWASLFFDYNNDTFEDLYVAQMAATNVLFKYDGTFPMTDVSAAMAMDDPGTTFAVAAADIDLDGDIDLAVATVEVPLRLFINQEGDNRAWTRLKIKGKGPNTHAIGATARLTNLGVTQMREVRAGVNYKADNERLLHFGLGDAPGTNIERIEVRWPNSTVRRVLRGYLVNNTWTVYHPSQLGDPDNSGTIDPDEIQQAVQIFLANNGGEINPGEEIFDFDGDCDVDWNDIASMLAQYATPSGSVSAGPGPVQP